MLDSFQHDLNLFINAKLDAVSNFGLIGTIIKSKFNLVATGALTFQDLSANIVGLVGADSSINSISAIENTSISEISGVILNMCDVAEKLP